MSEKKSKLKKILIPIIIVVVIATAICLFFVIKSNNNKKNNDSPVENVNNGSNIESQINSAVTNLNVCVEYNGNYIFQAVMGIEFNEEMSAADEKKAYLSIAQVKDKNSFINYLSEQKKYTSTNEVITLVNGKYTKSIGSTKAETGLFFGNLDKSIIFKKDANGTNVFDGINYTPSTEISLSGYWLQNNLSNNDGSIIYIREKVHYGNLGEKFMYVTYAYKMIEL